MHVQKVLRPAILTHVEERAVVQGPCQHHGAVERRFQPSVN